MKEKEIKQTDLDMTGIRERPTKGEKEQPYHMTSIVRKLFPDIEWRHNRNVIDRQGNKVNIKGKTPRPDFLSTELGLIIEIDGDRKGMYKGHFSDFEKAQDDIEKNKIYKDLDYKVIRIPPYVQLDSVMIKHYFNLEYAEKLYPAASEHGFAHPQISLPAIYCELGIERFEEDMKTLPLSVRDKIILTLNDRIADLKNKGYTSEDAMKKVLPLSLWHYLK